MSSRADIYRQKAAEIKQSAARAKNPSTKRAFEEVARGGLLLAEQIAWMQSKSVYSSNGKTSRFPPNSRMLEIAISLIVGLALGYVVREWTFRQDRLQQRRRRPFWNST
jgi:hypothetical protein